MQEKDITISSLSQKTISPKPGATWKAFTVYQILGNDGNTYETTDPNFYKGLTMGQALKIKFMEESKNVGGRIYTSYKIVTDKPNPALASTIRVLERLDKMEKTILDTIKEMFAPKRAGHTSDEVVVDIGDDDEPVF